MKIPVLVYTDIGRDVDDVLAICYMAGNPLIEIVGVVTTHMIPDRRAMIARALLDSLRLESVPVGVGSIHTLDRDSEVPRYLKHHKVNGATYEGIGLIPCFQSAKKVMIDCIEKYGKSLMVSVQAPLTDLAKITEQLGGVGGLFIQGNARLDTGTLEPHSVAYNISEDFRASIRVFHELRNKVPFTIIGKHAAYQCKLETDDFEAFRRKGTVAGKYLFDHAKAGIECFAQRDPHSFSQVFKGKTIDEVGISSNPYDALLAMAMAHPEMFAFEEFGNHRLAGMLPETHGIVDATASKAHLLLAIMTSCQRSTRIKTENTTAAWWRD